MESRGPTRILWNETAGELSGENAERGRGVYRAEPLRAQSGGILTQRAREGVRRRAGVLFPAPRLSGSVGWWGIGFCPSYSYS